MKNETPKQIKYSAVNTGDKFKAKGYYYLATAILNIGNKSPFCLLVTYKDLPHESHSAFAHQEYALFNPNLNYIQDGFIFRAGNRKAIQIIDCIPVYDAEILMDWRNNQGRYNWDKAIILPLDVIETLSSYAEFAQDSVKSGENVEVHGSVCGGVVEGQNVFIKMGVQGMHKGRILAEKNVVAKFIENAQVVAGEEVIVSEAILHSKVSAGKRIIVDGKRGMVIGGTITAGEEIRSKSLGTHMATNTEVEVGVNPMLREEHQALKRDLRKQELSLDQTQKALALLRSRDLNSLPPEKRDIMLKMTKAQFQLAGQVESMRSRMVEIELSLEEMRNGRVRVMDTVYPGVKIVLGNLVKFIREPEKFVSYYAEDGDIHKGSYK